VPGVRRRARVGLAALVVGLAGLVVAVAACSGSSTPGGTAGVALQVNGWQLSTQEFLDELGQIAANQAYIAARTSDNGGQPYQVFEPGTSNPNPNVAAELLNERVSFELVAEELKSRNLSITDADRSQAVGLIGQSLQRAQQRETTNGTTAPGVPVSEPPTTDLAATGTTESPADATATIALGHQILDGFKGSYQQTLLDGVAGTLALQRSLADPNDDKVKQSYESQKDEACVSHILVLAGPNAGQTDSSTGQLAVPSDADYQAALVKITGIRAQLVGGADFATVAKSSSDDTSTKDNGGDLGCQAKGAYDQGLDDAIWSQPLGQLSAPVKSSVGYHLIIVRSKQTVPFDAFVLQAQGQALQDFLQQAAQNAQVVLAPSLGTWDAQSGSVQPAGATNLTLSPLDTQSVLPGPPQPANPLAGLEPGTTR
jgi:hypothetical protein